MFGLCCLVLGAWCLSRGVRLSVFVVGCCLFVVGWWLVVDYSLFVGCRWLGVGGWLCSIVCFVLRFVC